MKESNLQPAFDREAAMQWWNNLSSPQKTQLCDTNTELVGRWETLTGREIEIIWRKETFIPNN